MTTLIAWVSYDPKFAASYMASDSRITWSNSSTRRWDAGRKIFPSKLFPDIFGYAGDVVFPALALSQIVESFDAGLLCSQTATPWERHEAVLACLKDSFRRRHQADDRDFSVMHLSRSDELPARTIHAWSIDYNAGTAIWTDRILAVPLETGIVGRLGSGASAARMQQERWSSQPYSREIFSSFCDSISSGRDGLSGGAPQLAGFYPHGPARGYGLWYRGEAFFNGLPLLQPAESHAIEWRDDLFQRIDISTRSLVSGAQIQTRPRGI